MYIRVVEVSFLWLRQLWLRFFSCSSLLRSTSFPTRPFDFFPPSSPCYGERCVAVEEEVSDDVAYGARGWRILFHYENVFILRSGTGEEIVRVIHPRCGPVPRFFLRDWRSPRLNSCAKLGYKMLNAKRINWFVNVKKIDRIRWKLICKSGKIYTFMAKIKKQKKNLIFSFWESSFL